MQVLALSIQEGKPDPIAKIRAFRKRHKVTYPILSDEKATIINRFGFEGIPANVVLSKQGVYAAKPETVEEIVREVEKQLR